MSVIILMHVMAHSATSIRACVLYNQRFLEGSFLTLLYLIGSFLIGCMEVRYSLLYYVAILDVSYRLLHKTWLLVGSLYLALNKKYKVAVS